MNIYYYIFHLFALSIRGNTTKPMKIIYLFFALQASLMCANAQVAQYFNDFKSQGSFNLQLEQELLNSTSPHELFKKLNEYYSDTLVQVRQQAYYLSYKLGIQSDEKNQVEAVHSLLNGCNDANQSVVGRCLSYLKSFPIEAYDTPAKESLMRMLQIKQITHFRATYTLVGYVGVGMGIIKQQLLGNGNYNRSQLWIMQLALARMGDVESVEHCLQMADKVEDGNDKVAYLVPDLLYTRKKKAVDYCVEILYSDQNNCLSPNPDRDTKILCGYRVLELLAPIVVDFPYKAGPAGSLIVDDYEKALLGARDWFLQHPDYNILTDTF